MIENPQKVRWGNDFDLWMLPFRLQKHPKKYFLEYCRVARTKLCSHRCIWAASGAFFNLGSSHNFLNVSGQTMIIMMVFFWFYCCGFQGLVVHFQSYVGKEKLIVMAAENIFPQPHQLCMDCAHALNLMISI